jgi:hypothetical protein
MNKHTPGPWRLDEYGEIVGGKHGSPVCELPPASMLAGSITESDANTHLIAAAPEMLEALERLEQASLNMARIVNKTRDDAATVAEWDKARQEVNEARMQAIRAMSKARGH